jgi:hypothetical protein
MRIDYEYKQIENLKPVYKSLILDNLDAMQLIKKLSSSKENIFFRGLISTSSNEEIVLQ